MSDLSATDPNNTPGLVIRHVHRCDLMGKGVRTLRRARSLTQAQLAAKAGVSRKWLSEFENGKDTVELGLFLKLLKCLDYRIELHPSAPEFDLDAYLDKFRLSEDALSFPSQDLGR